MQNKIMSVFLLGMSAMTFATELPLSKEMQKQYQTKPNKELKCQAIKFEEVDYCLTVFRKEKVNNIDYQLVIGRPFMNGEFSQSHADVGIASYATTTEGLTKISGFIPHGTMGEPVDNWKLLKLSNNEMVWKAEVSDSHQGNGGTRVQILSANGTDMFGKVISFSDIGACPDTKCEKRATDIVGSFTMSAQGLPVINLKGKLKGKKYNKDFT